MIDTTPPRTATLPDGTPVVVRPVRPDDAAQLQDGFAHLSAETRQRRFLSGVSRLPPNHIDNITHVDGVHHLVWGIETLDGEGFGVAHVIREVDDRTRAEFAIVIADAWQGRGAGKVLTRALAERSYDLGVRTWIAVLALDNHRVQRLLSSIADELSRKNLGYGTGEVLYALRPTARPSYTPSAP